MYQSRQSIEWDLDRYTRWVSNDEAILSGHELTLELLLPLESTDKTREAVSFCLEQINAAKNRINMWSADKAKAERALKMFDALEASENEVAA